MVLTVFRRRGLTFAWPAPFSATADCDSLASVTSDTCGCYIGGIVADRWARTTLTMAAMVLSGLCALLIGFTFGGPPGLTLAIAAIWGITIIADSAQFSTAV